MNATDALRPLVPPRVRTYTVNTAEIRGLLSLWYDEKLEKIPTGVSNEKTEAYRAWVEETYLMTLGEIEGVERLASAWGLMFAPTKYRVLERIARERSEEPCRDAFAV